MYRIAARCADITVGTIHRVLIDGHAIALMNIDGAFYAVQDRCTHADYPLSEGRMEGDRIICLMHHACFDARTGQSIERRFAPLHKYNLRVSGDLIEVELPDDKTPDSWASSGKF
jgi:nitrite reductase/ring-hydroxylating ferredoxin subunit